MNELFFAFNSLILNCCVNDDLPFVELMITGTFIILSFFEFYINIVEVEAIFG